MDLALVASACHGSGVDAIMPNEAAQTAEAGEGVVLLDARGRVVDVSPSAKVLLPDLQQGRAFAPVLEDAAGVVDAVEHRLPTGQRVVVLRLAPPTGGGDVLQAQLAELRRSNDELRRFAHTVSHDLQEPLRVVRSYGELLEHRDGGSLSESGREYLGYILEGANQMQALIGDLLEFARARGVGAPARPVDADVLCDHVLTELSHAIEQVGGRVTQHPLPVVLATDTQLRQVFRNLIHNAVKYRSEEPLRVVVRARAEAGVVRFEVEDNGIGIRPSDRERVFNIFERLPEGQHQQGTGVGLALCRHIVHTLGGQIGVEGVEPRGSRFWFTLPGAEES